MKKYFILAIAALGAFALASCSNEKESPIVATDGAKVTVTLGEGAKATMLNPTADSAGFVFQTGDVINWVSKSGNASYTYTGEDSKTITFDVEIPGLAAGDVEGYFAVNFTDEVPYCFNASNPTQAQAGINPGCFFLSSYTKTLAKGSESVSVDVKPVGGVFAFQFKGAGDKVFKVEVGAENTWCNNASFDGYALVLDPVMSKLATNVDVEMTDAYDTQCIFIPVPSGITLDEPYVKIYAKSGMYTYDFGGTAVAPEGDLTFEDAVIKKIKLPLDETLCDKFEAWAKGLVTLTAECISSNDPMQYVSEGLEANEYGFKGNPDWWNSLSSVHATNRANKYGKADNLWDDDAATSYHLNLDYGEPGTSWGIRKYNINSSYTEKRYVQVTLPAGMDEFDLEFTNADSGREAEGLELLVTTDGSNWTKVPDTDFSKDFGAENSVEGVTADGLIKAIRIQNTLGWSGDPHTDSAFGIAELSIYGTQIYATDPGKVTGVALDQTSATVYIGKESVNLTATVFPETADVTDVVWTSSDPSIATVAGGVVTAVAEGNVTITAKTVDGGLVATCDVTSADPSAHMVLNVAPTGDKKPDGTYTGWVCAMQFSSPKYIKFGPHKFEENGQWASYLEIIQEGVSYYISDWESVKNLGTIAGLSVVTATDEAGEDYVIPCSGVTGTMFTWVTSQGGLIQTTSITANTEISFANDPSWGGNVSGVSTNLTKGNQYASILYDKNSDSAKWKLIPVTTTKPE